MNWLTSHYFREGPGISKDMPKPTGLRLLAFTIRREWWELMKLNLLFIAVSLPLVTLPAAYLAMTRITVTMIEDRNVWLWRDFLAAFREQFRSATLAGAALACAMALAWLAVATYAAAATDRLAFVPPLVVALCVLVSLPLLGMHVFAALASQPRASLGDAIRASALGLLAHPLPGLAALAAIGALWLAHILLYPASAFLPVLVNFSLGALVSCLAVRRGVQFGFSRIQAGATKPAGEPDTQSA